MLGEQCDVVVVVRSLNNSNLRISRCLANVAIARRGGGHLIDGPEEIVPAWLNGKQNIGIAAGASPLEILVKRVVDRISRLNGATLD